MSRLLALSVCILESAILQKSLPEDPVHRSQVQVPQELWPPFIVPLTPKGVPSLAVSEAPINKHPVQTGTVGKPLFIRPMIPLAWPSLLCFSYLSSQLLTSWPGDSVSAAACTVPDTVLRTLPILLCFISQLCCKGRAISLVTEEEKDVRGSSKGKLWLDPRLSLPLGPMAASSLLHGVSVRLFTWFWRCAQLAVGHFFVLNK